MESISIKEFRKKHQCRLCFYYTKMKKCFANSNCPLEVNESDSSEKKKCPLDEDGTCPYGNGAGTCFGFCIKQILQEQKEGKKKYEQTEEEEKDG